VKKGQVLTILVTGNEGDDYGPFKLTVDLAKAGSSLATATFIGSDAKMEVSGCTQGYAQTYVNKRCNGNVAADGPDVVRAAQRVSWCLRLVCCVVGQGDCRACSALARCSAVFILLVECCSQRAGSFDLPACLPACLPAVLLLLICHCWHAQG
jgi:hypothetical protein